MFDKKTACICAVTPWLLLLCGTLHAAMPDAKLATEILNEAGVKGGLIVHVGCGDGTVTAALHRNDGCLVHGLTVDDGKMERARAFLRQKGVYGPVAVDSFDGARLPYADGAVNLVVSEDLKQVPMAEVQRVLSPHGVAYLKQDGDWRKIVMPWPETIDDWSHYLHGHSR
ncbi:MAG: class I SAM-dependent methyltransferase [Pirellulaceae bacterium]